jgi:DNA-binding transcriptional ArsR family regulator
MNYSQMEHGASEASRLLKAMANERRLLILCYLAEAEHSVGQLVERVGLSQSALSQHLAKLRSDGLVETRRDAQNIFYSLSGQNVTRVLQVLHELYCPPK